VTVLALKCAYQNVGRCAEPARIAVMLFQGKNV
jgi:hypothetical protein